MSALDNRIPPPLVMLAVAGLMLLAWGRLPPTPYPLAPRLGVAALVLAVAGWFGFSAFAAFRRANTTINPVAIDTASALVTGSVFGLTRNPMYVGLTGLLTALAVGLGQAWLLIGPLLFALYITRFQILPEERVMAARFGADYAAYRGRVRRWL